MTRLIIEHNKQDKSVKNSIYKIKGNQSFISGINEIRENHKTVINSPNFKFDQLLNNYQSEVYHDLNKLRRRLRYGDAWLYFFAYFLIHEKSPTDFNPRLPFIEQDRIHGDFEDEFSLRLFPNTTLRDIQYAWGNIKVLISKHATKDRGLKKLNETIMDLYNNDYPLYEIRKKIKKQYNKTLIKKQIQRVINDIKKQHNG